MSEHPILFSGEMVRAILDGRKTQTRRVNVERYMKLKRGDRLWVREAWHLCGADTPDGKLHTEVVYRADGETCSYCGAVVKWKRSKYMPRWASRITLQLTEDVRVEPVQSITWHDCFKEGISYVSKTGESDNFIDAYCNLWDSINAKRGYSWASNPDVAVITFRRV